MNHEKPSKQKPSSAHLSELKDVFHVIKADRGWKQAIPRRGTAVQPFEGVDNSDANWMKVIMYDSFGLTEYNDCWTGEMNKRPIPFVSFDSKPLYAKQLFERYISYVLDALLPRMEPHTQPINKISALGDPVNGNPGDGLDFTGRKTHADKFDVTMEFFRMFQAGDFSSMEHTVNTIGKRLQNESPSKVREFQFINSDGEVYMEKTTAEQRSIYVPDLGPMIGSRTRTIVRPPVINLYLQCFDSMIHNAIMSYPLCDSNVYTTQRWPSGAKFRTFDCQHFERYLGLTALSYADAIGGLYGHWLTHLIKAPFIVPSDDWKTVWEITPLYREGVYPQFSSGLSPVAPLGKLANICAQTAYFVEHKGLTPATAVATVLSGASQGLRRWMYGDDNRLMGEPGEMADFIKFMATVFEIDEDETPKYLGTVYRSDEDKFMLPSKTYLLKMFQPERSFSWKDYPNLGLVERRAVFVQFGEPEIARKIIPLEDKLWNEIGHPWYEIVSRSITEKRKASEKGVQLTSLQLTDKEYLMTEKEQLSSGLYWHLKPAQTATIVLQLVSTAIRERLAFRNAPVTPIDVPAKQFPQYSPQNNEDDESEEETDTSS